MARYVRAQVAISNDTGMPRDLAVNVWHFWATDDGTEEALAGKINTALTGFYHAIDDVVYSDNVGPDLRVKLFDMEDAPPRVPFSDITATITPSSVSGLPAEVAICLSFRAASGSGTNRRRQTGRVYLGPLSNNISQDADGDMAVSPTARTMITQAAADHLLELATAPGSPEVHWCVFSRSDALGLAIGEEGPTQEPTYTEAQLFAGFHSVQTGWCDDAFDTQRRRGLRPRTRTTF